MPVDSRRYSISTRSITRDFTTAVRCAAEVGFAALEVWEEDIRPLGGVPFLRGLLDETGLSVAQYQLVRNIDGVPEQLLSQSLDGARRLLDEAAKIGAGSLLACSSMENVARDDLALAADQLNRLVELAVPYGMPIAYEAVAFASINRRVADAWRLVKHIDHPKLGITLDSTHMALMGEDFGDIGKIPAEKIFFVQIADLPRLSGDWVSLSRTERLFPGEGMLDLDSYLGAVERTGYRGHYSLEVFNKANDQLDAMAVARRAADTYRSLLARVADVQAGDPPRRQFGEAS